MTRVYIAGKMRGVQFYNHPAFHEAEQHLISLGYDVVSPARLDLEEGFLMAHLPDDHDWNEMPPGMDYEETMTRDLAALDTCDAIYMLRGWRESQGAKREQLHAAVAGTFEFFEQDVLEPPDVAIDAPRDKSPNHEVLNRMFEVVAEDSSGPLPTEKPDRKHVPIESGCHNYFPNALAAIAYCSWVGNEQHNPGEPLHWAKEKSNDHGDCAARHRKSLGTLDDDNVWHDFKVAWRELARLETMLENHPERRVL